MRRDTCRFFGLVSLVCAGSLAGCGGRTGLDPGPGSPPDGLHGDVCVELPPRQPPEFVDVAFTPRIQVADVLLLIDATGSMDSTLRILQYALRTGLMPDLLANVPDVRLGLASFQDFDLPGRHRIYPFRLDQRMTTELPRLQAAVERIEVGSGGDGAEAQIEALYQVATGAGLRGYVPRAHCPRDTAGYPCFRESGARLILLFTDCYFHGGPAGAGFYQPGSITPPPATYAQGVQALNAIGAKVIGIFAGRPDECVGAIEDLRGVARDTGTVTPDGEPIVFDIGRSALGLGEGVADSVRRVVEDMPLDVDLLLEPVSEDFDPALFVVAIEALDASPPEGALVQADAFQGVRPGTRVRFRLQLQNESIERSSEDQRFYLRAVLRGDHVTRLQETLVEIVVPAVDGLGCDSAES